MVLKVIQPYMRQIAVFGKVIIGSSYRSRIVVLECTLFASYRSLITSIISPFSGYHAKFYTTIVVLVAFVIFA